ncbi:Cell division cycle protein 123-like protein [Frankliniella fusca]|uniref:Cell division cycle protein 123-like protein n=1 Tax=Frankliniella fusca TaxID=407009 RepID=A0AAE1H258_9NEOP|nr:Cell division cycle protein 123-like protein [Frankliniella fusca]
MALSRSSTPQDVVAFLYASDSVTEATAQEIYDMEEVNFDSDDEWSEDDGGGIMAVDLLPNGRRNMEHAAANMIVEMRAVSGMTRVGVRRAMKIADQILLINNTNLKEDVTTYLASVNLLNTLEARQLLRKFDVDSPFKGMYSNESQISAVKDYYFYPRKETVFIWNRMDQRLDGDDVYIQRPVPNTYEYVPLKEIVRQVARRPEILEYMRSLHPSADGMLNCFTDGNQYRQSQFFRDHPDAFQFALYFDGVDPARSQGPKAGMHELGNFLLRILNLPPKINNSMASIFPLILANINDCKETFEGVLRRFVDDLLEFENGVEMNFERDRTERIYGTLVAAKGDAKAIHALLGLLDPGGAKHFCRDCMISREELHGGHVAFGEPRTQQLTEEQLAMIRDNPNHTRNCGLRYRTVLHDSQYFRLEENKNFDILHDFSEGIIPMLMRLCLKEFIVDQQWVDVNALNARIFAFNYGKANQRDKPNLMFDRASLQDAARNHSVKQNGAQINLLFRALPFLLDGISENEDQMEHSDHYQMYMLLMKIFQIAMAPKVPRDVLPLLRRYLEQFRRSWYDVFPQVRPINKFHHIMHLPETLELKGPARQFSCFREESKNCPIKRHIVTCNNFINPQKTSMEQILIFQAKAWGGRDLNVIQKTRFSGKQIKTVRELPCAATLEVMGLPPAGRIQTAKAVEIFGVEYRLNQYLLIIPENEDNLPCFGKISAIIRPVNRDQETVLFSVKACTTDGFVERLNAYTVSCNDDAPNHLIELHDLPHHVPISSWHQQLDGADFMDLTSEDLLKNFPNILFKQRKELMKLVESFKSSDAAAATKDNVHDQSCILLGYLDPDDKVVKPLTSTDSLVNAFQTTPCLSKSLVSDNQLSSGPSAKSKKRSHSPANTEVVVEPMPVYEILHKQGVLGQNVIRFVKDNKWIDLKHQSDMLRILTDYVLARNNGNMYPSSLTKVSMAKGIITDFPELADPDNGFDSWFNPTTSRGIIQTKFQSLRKRLHPEEKKNKERANQSRKDHSTQKCQGENSEVQSSQEPGPSHQGDCSRGGEEERKIQDLVATPQNFNIISTGLRNTFVSRRQWMHSCKPTCTDILTKYKHLASYEGEMLSQEFQMIQPLANNLIEVFKKWAPHIITYASKTKPNILDSLRKEFPDTPDNTLALLLLPKLLPTVANARTMKAAELQHIQTYKPLLEALVCSAVVQIVPEGTNVYLYSSAEAPAKESERKSSIYPFLVWTTNDRKSGQVYLKIDNQTFYLGSSSTTDNLLLKGFDLSVKAYYAFDLDYHPYLKTTYMFIEILYNISKTSNSTVTKLMNALRGIASS